MGGEGDCADTCPVPHDFLSYQPALAASICFIGAFVLLVPVNIYTAIRNRSVIFGSALIAGLLAEAVGYAGRLLLHADGANYSFFALFMMGTIIGPTFIGTAISSLLPRLAVLYGRGSSLVPRPLYLQIFFLGLDVFTLAFQAVGVAFTVYGASQAETSQGIDILLAGLAMHVTSLGIFLVIYWMFRSRSLQRLATLNAEHSNVRLSRKLRTYIICIQLAVGLLLFRAAARILQFCPGMPSVFAQSEIVPLVLDGTVVVLATILVTVISPGAAFGSTWGSTSPFSKDRTARATQQGPLRMGTESIERAILRPVTPSRPEIPYFPPPPTAYYCHPRPPPLHPPRYPVPRYDLPRHPYEVARRPAPTVTRMANLVSPTSSFTSGRARNDGMVVEDSLW